MLDETIHLFISNLQLTLQVVPYAMFLLFIVLKNDNNEVFCNFIF